MQLVKAEEQSTIPRSSSSSASWSSPQGYQPPVIRGIDVHYEEQTDVEYKTVTILPDGLKLEVVDRRQRAVGGQGAEPAAGAVAPAAPH